MPFRPAVRLRFHTVLISACPLRVIALRNLGAAMSIFSTAQAIRSRDKLHGVHNDVRCERGVLVLQG